MYYNHNNGEKHCNGKKEKYQSSKKLHKLRWKSQVKIIPEEKIETEYYSCKKGLEKINSEKDFAVC